MSASATSSGGGGGGAYDTSGLSRELEADLAAVKEEIHRRMEQYQHLKPAASPSIPVASPTAPSLAFQLMTATAALDIGAVRDTLDRARRDKIPLFCVSASSVDNSSSDDSSSGTTPGADVGGAGGALPCEPLSSPLGTTANSAASAPRFDQRDLDGQTPLHVSASKGSVELTRLLLEYGLKPDVEDDAGMTPMEIARGAGHDEVVDVLGKAIRTSGGGGKGAAAAGRGGGAGGLRKTSSNGDLSSVSGTPSAAQPQTTTMTSPNQFSLTHTKSAGRPLPITLPRVNSSGRLTPSGAASSATTPISSLAGTPGIPSYLSGGVAAYLAAASPIAPAEAAAQQRANSIFDSNDYAVGEEKVKGVIVLVGLPARGKTYFARRVQRFFMFKGAEVHSFSAGDVRRRLFPSVSRSSINNAQAERVSDELALQASKFLVRHKHSEHCAAIIDGLNHSRALRARLFNGLCSHGVPPTAIVFLEVVVTDKDVVEHHISTAVSDFMVGDRNIKPCHFNHTAASSLGSLSSPNQSISPDLTAGGSGDGSGSGSGHKGSSKAHQHVTFVGGRDSAAAAAAAASSHDVDVSVLSSDDDQISSPITGMLGRRPTMYEINQSPLQDDFDGRNKKGSTVAADDAGDTSPDSPTLLVDGTQGMLPRRSESISTPITAASFNNNNKQQKPPHSPSSNANINSSSSGTTVTNLPQKHAETAHPILPASAAAAAASAEEMMKAEEEDDDDVERAATAEDFTRKYRSLIRQMEERYETMDEQLEGGLCFARSVNRSQLKCHNLAYTPLGRTMVKLLMDLHEYNKRYFLATIGETEADAEDRYGLAGTTPLTARGVAYSHALAEYLCENIPAHQLISETTVFTCSAPAARQTVAPLLQKFSELRAEIIAAQQQQEEADTTHNNTGTNSDGAASAAAASAVGPPKTPTSSSSSSSSATMVRYLHTLDDLSYGDCEGMTRSEALQWFPRHMRNMAADPYGCEFPRGESLQQLMQLRLEQHLSELEAVTVSNIVLVVPVSVAKALMLYFDPARFPVIRPEHAVKVDVPQGHVVCLEGNDRDAPKWAKLD